MARPTKFTEETRAAILAQISKGAAYELACAAARVSYQTFRNWMERGENAKRGEFLEFFEAVKEAEAEAAAGWLDEIDKAAEKGSWQAAAWKLERRYPHLYGRTVHTPPGAPIETRDANKSKSTAEKIREIDEHISELNAEIAEAEAEAGGA
jgi:transposase-like protein